MRSRHRRCRGAPPPAPQPRRDLGSPTAQRLLALLIAALIGGAAVALLAPPLTELAYLFGPAEYVAILLLGLVAAVVLAPGSITKSLAMLVAGLLLAQIESLVKGGGELFGQLHAHRHRVRTASGGARRPDPGPDRGGARVRRTSPRPPRWARPARVTATARAMGSLASSGPRFGSRFAARPSARSDRLHSPPLTADAIERESAPTHTTCQRCATR